MPSPTLCREHNGFAETLALALRKLEEDVLAAHLESCGPHYAPSQGSCTRPSSDGGPESPSPAAFDSEHSEPPPLPASPGRRVNRCIFQTPPRPEEDTPEDDSGDAGAMEVHRSMLPESDDFTEAVSLRMRQETGFRISAGTFMLDPGWRRSAKTERSPAHWSISGTQVWSSRDEDSIPTFRCRCVIHPEARLRLAWIITGACLLFYDMVLLPLQLSSLVDTTSELQAVQWMSLMYWIIDLPVNFITGFYQDGVVEMRPSAVARQYLKGWFVSDILIVTIDVCTGLVTILDAMSSADNESTKFVRIARSARVMRGLRLLRLMRFRRVLEVATRIFDSCMSELGLLVARVVSLVGFLLVLNHFIACIWYSLGRMYEEGVQTWLPDREWDPLHAYVCSFHWALTQFTPATQNLAPVTTIERFFANVTVLVALVTFSTFLGKMTTAMTQLLNLNAKIYQQEAMLRRFLGENKIPAAMAQRVWQVCRQQQQSNARQQVPTLLDVNKSFALPTDLQIVLCQELYLKHLLQLPIFRKMLSVRHPETGELCTILEDRCAVPSQEVFAAGAEAHFAVCMMSGKMMYNSILLMEPVQVGLGDWLSEQVMWGAWSRCGSLTTTSTCRWLEMSGKSFRELFQRHGDRNVRRAIHQYAVLYARHMEKGVILDILQDSDREVNVRLAETAAAIIGTQAGSGHGRWWAPHVPSDGVRTG